MIMTKSINERMYHACRNLIKLIRPSTDLFTDFELQLARPQNENRHHKDERLSEPDWAMY
jgi:hypothetical protein